MLILQEILRLEFLKYQKVINRKFGSPCVVVTDQDLIDQANTAIQKAYAPYSNFKVGAALLTKSGMVYTGVNIENISFSPTVCAERVAVFKAVSDGILNFKKIVITSEDANPSPPCGVCRQVLGEFVDDSFEIILITTSGSQIMRYSYKELFPLRFVPQRSIGNHNAWQELRRVIQRDNIITEEEFMLVQAIIDDVNRLEEHVDILSIEDSLTEKDRETIQQLREKVYASAHATANLDDTITDEESAILKKLAEILNINQ